MEYNAKDTISSIEQDSILENLNDSQVNIFNEILTSLTDISSNDKNQIESPKKKDLQGCEKSIESQEIILQLTTIKGKVNELKERLRGSEELIAFKNEENIRLKEEIENLQNKSISKDSLPKCNFCVIV